MGSWSMLVGVIFVGIVGTANVSRAVQVQPRANASLEPPGSRLSLFRCIDLVPCLRFLRFCAGIRWPRGKIEPPFGWRKCLINAAPFCYSLRMSSNLDQLTADAMKLPLRDRVQLAQRLVSTIDDEEYFTALLQEQQKVRSEEKLERMLAQGLATESSALNKEDWQHARAELENRITQNK